MAGVDHTEQPHFRVIISAGPQELRASLRQVPT